MANADTPEDTSLSIAELEHEVKRLALSRDITREFVATTDMKKLMSIIFTGGVETLPAEAGSLWMVDWKTRENVCHLAEGPAKDKVVGLRLPAGKGIVGAVIQSRKADAVLDCSKDSRFAADVDKKTGFETRSMVTAPLVVGKHVYGAIQVINKRGSNDGFFNDDDLEMVKDLGISAGVSIKNARLLESESRVKEMGKLMTISNEIASSLDLDQVLDYTVQFLLVFLQLFLVEQIHRFLDQQLR